MSKGIKIAIILLVIAIVIAAVVVACLQTGVVCVVRGESMMPTYKDGKLLFLDVKNKDIERDDVVVFTHPFYEGKLVKRVIAVAGDRVVVSGTAIYVNGRRVKPVDGAINAQLKEEYYIDTIVSEGCVFCVGDNRDNSLDSREFGEVSIEDIIGVVKN